MPTEVTFPSGLVGEIRELGIEEENVFTNPKLARNAKALHRVFKNCWEKTVEPSIYEFGESGFQPGKLLQGDGIVYLALLRIESYGPEFLFDVNCPICGEKIPWEVDLKGYLEENIQWLPDDSKRIIRDEKGIFKCTLPRCGKEISFRLLTLRDELAFPRVRRESGDKMSSAVLDMAIAKIEGIEDDKARRIFLGLEPMPDGWTGEKQITSGDANYFRQELESVNCGLETNFGVECTTHGEVTVELPFRGDFLLPRRRRR